MWYLVNKLFVSDEELSGVYGQTDCLYRLNYKSEISECQQKYLMLVGIFMDISEILIEKIQTLAKEQNISVNTMLKECGINRSLVSDLKSKGSIPSADKLSKIADYFNVSTDYLLGRTIVRHTYEVAAASSDIPYDQMPPEALEELEKYKQYLISQFGKKKQE